MAVSEGVLRMDPGLWLCEVDGITVVLRAVDCGPTKTLVSREAELRLHLHLAAVPNAVTDRLDSRFAAEMQAWEDAAAGARRDDKLDGLPPPPEQPGVRLAHLRLEVEDDVGTQYVLQRTKAAGSGTEWLAEWSLGPGVPRGATQLMITVNGEGTEQRTHAVPLWPESPGTDG